MTTVYTAGVFDLLHVGHLSYLQRARALGDFLVVGMHTDEFATFFKQQPIIPFEQRRQIIEALSCVDATVPVFGFKDIGWIEFFNATIRVVSEDYGAYKEQREIRAGLEAKGVQYVILPRTPEVSTTRIKEVCCEKLVASGACRHDRSWGLPGH